jgi:ArsR family transcriptional regulator
MKHLTRVLKAVADESRLRILGMLNARTLCVCEIAEVLGLAQSTVSRHLKVLEDCGLVDRRKDGLWVEYSLSSPPEDSVPAKLLSLVQDSLDSVPLIRKDRQKAQQVDRNIVCQRT